MSSVLNWKCVEEKVVPLNCLFENSTVRCLILECARSSFTESPRVLLLAAEKGWGYLWFCGVDTLWAGTESWGSQGEEAHPDCHTGSSLRRVFRAGGTWKVEYRGMTRIFRGRRDQRNVCASRPGLAPVCLAVLKEGSFFWSGNVVFMLIDFFRQQISPMVPVHKRD